jgi:hypothetical protein
MKKIHEYLQLYDKKDIPFILYSILKLIAYFFIGYGLIQLIHYIRI